MLARLAVLLISAAATVVGAMALVSPALAGSFDIHACSPLATPGLWARVNEDPAGFNVGQACGGPPTGPFGEIGPQPINHQGGVFAEDILNTPTLIANGARAGWLFTAPAGTTIIAIRYERAFASYVSSDVRSGLFEASGAPLEQCMTPWPFLPTDDIVCSKPNALATFAGLSTSSLFFGVLCRIVDNATACIDNGTIHAAQAVLYSATVTLSQPAPPTLSPPGGALFAGGIVSGTVPVTFAASDPSGIQHEIVRSESGPTLATADQACDFSVAQPCPELPAASLSVDTTRVPDGPHTFSVVVTDAAANTQTATSPPIVVDNNGPSPPTRLTATPQGGGSTAFDLKWANPPSPAVPIIAARAVLCRGSSCAAALSVSPAGAAHVTAPVTGTYTVRLWLLDAQGRGGPQNAAQTDITVPGTGGSTGTLPPGAPSSNGSKVTAVITGRRLRVTGTIAMPRGRVSVSWRSRSDGLTVGRGSRLVAVRSHRIAVTFTLTQLARGGTVKVAVRSGHSVIANTSALACAARRVPGHLQC